MSRTTKLLRFTFIALLLLLSVCAHAGTVTYVYTDPQGTPLAEADAQGNITARFDYTPYGKSVASLGASPNGPGYTGHVNDKDTGLVYMQARYYDPEIGRFLSVDPVESEVGNGFNFNRYSYADNNPIVKYDPDGLQSSDQSPCDIECKRQKQEGQEQKNNAPYTGGEGAVASSNSIGHKLLGVYKAVSNGLCDLPIVGCDDGSNPLAANDSDELQGMVAGGVIFDLAKLAATDGLSLEAEESTLWSSTGSSTSMQNAFGHWMKHSAEFPEYQNALQYVSGAKSFVSHPPEGTLIRVSANGNTMYYNPSSNIFAVKTPGGVPRTMFRPADGMGYWMRQK